MCAVSNSIIKHKLTVSVVGLDFFITEIPFEVFTYSEQNPMSFVRASSNIYPYLVCCNNFQVFYIIHLLTVRM